MQTKEHPRDTLAKALHIKLQFMPLTEYAFNDDRLWALDIAFPLAKVGVEVDGVSHLFAKRHRQDCEKRNAAIQAGWRILAYPASAIKTPKRLARIVDQIYLIVCDIVGSEGADCVLTGE